MKKKLTFVDAILNRKKYKGLSWFENFMGGHMSFLNVTIYGENAMHWSVVISTKRWGYVSFRLPLRCFGDWWPMHFFVSPNGTPWASTFYRGPRKQEVLNSKVRREEFGHNFSTDEHDDRLSEINNR